MKVISDSSSLTALSGIGKLNLLLCHQSQYKWLKEHDGIDYIDAMRKVASFRGLQCGVPYAEGFQAYSVWGRIKVKRLLP